jgi:uncharacterized protein (TIGR01619 family)
VDSSWDVYLTMLDNKPAFVSVDSALARAAPLRSHPDLVMCQVPVRSFRDNGLPSEDAFKSIYGFEDRADAIARASDSNIYAGRFGVAEFVTYHYYTNAAEALIKKFETSSELKAITPFACKAMADPQWSYYFDFLYPQPETRNSIENEKVREALRNAGDNGSEPRKVDHYAYFKDLASVEKYAQFVLQHQYAIERESTEPDERGQWLLLFSKSQKPIEIDSETWALRQEAVTLQGIYDGWGCPVVRAQP